MKFKFINPAHAYYRDELMLRWEVLCKPLGMPPGSEIVPEEMECIHLLVIDDKKIVGCVLFHPEKESTGRIVQLALSEEYRGQGFGRKLIHALEQEMSKKRMTSIYLYAREEFQGFYEKLGFHYEGEVFERMGSSHQVMRKSLLVDAIEPLLN